MNRRRINRRTKAVAPVLATLLMIAVAVAMSVIIFMWSQGFLAQTSESTGGQQGAQNQAAQSSISVEAVTFTKPDAITLVVRNVGAVSVELGSVSVTPGSANPTGSHLYKPITVSTLSATMGGDVNAPAGLSQNTTSTCSATTLPKGSAATIILNLDTRGTAPGWYLSSGDVTTIKLTTSVGTFAQSTHTVP